MGLFMQDAEAGTQKRRKSAETVARKERKINLLCFGLALILGIFAASAFLLNWIFEAPPLMP
jgi:t-SNARE complex subunit (syntaxin)